jgi:hypothetical protein
LYFESALGLDTEIRRSEVLGGWTDLRMKARKIIFNLSHRNDPIKIKRLLFSATASVIFILKVVWSGSDTGGLKPTFRMEIPPVAVVPENKSRSIWVQVSLSSKKARIKHVICAGLGDIAVLWNVDFLLLLRSKVLDFSPYSEPKQHH